MDIIFDIDGTLANTDHRQHHLTGKKKDWAAFQDAAHLDPVHEPIAVICRSLATLAHRIVLCSGRGEQERHITEAWLEGHQIPYARLYMRAEKDYRPDDVIKLELLVRMRVDGFDPKIAFDDRYRVVRMWRENGVVCAQVAEGAF